MQYQIQQMVVQGKITPEQAQVYLQNPSAFLAEQIPQTGTQAQEEEIANLLSDAEAGGISPQAEEAIQQTIGKLDTQEAGQRGAILNDAAARGALTGGETIAAEQEANQTDQASANQEGLSSAATAAELALQELTSAGSAGQALQGQENTQANTVAAAVDAINKFNAAQQEQTNQFNVSNDVAAQEANLANAQQVEEANVEAENAHRLQQSQLPAEQEAMAEQKAAAEAGVSEQGANLATEQGGQMAGLIGGAVGAAGEAGASALAPTPEFNVAQPVKAAGGGEIHDYREGGPVVADRLRERARVPGDAPANDKIPAELSEGEVVLPRTVAQHPTQDRVMGFLNRMRPRPVPKHHPDDINSVLDALASRRASYAA